MIKSLYENLSFPQPQNFYYDAKLETKQTEQCRLFDDKILPLIHMPINNTVPIINAETIFQNSVNFIDSNTIYHNPLANISIMPSNVLPFATAPDLDHNDGTLLNCKASCSSMALTTTINIDHNSNASTSTDITSTYSHSIGK